MNRGKSRSNNQRVTAKVVTYLFFWETMKIESITLHHISMPLVAPFETSFGRETNRQCVLITVQADGLTGYGECVATRDPGYNYETAGTAWHILQDFIAPLILGEDVVDADDF